MSTTSPKHTPGPWRVAPDDPRLIEYEDDDGQWRWLAELHFDGDGSDDWRDLGADARLLAAAVEMRDALRKAYRELNTIAARDGSPYTHQGIKSAVSEEYFLSVVDEARALLRHIDGEGA